MKRTDQARPPRGGRMRAACCLLLALALALTGCGGGDTPASSAASGEPASSSAASGPDDDDYDAAAGVIDKAAFSGTVLEETEDAGREYLDETLFLGDSNTYRYMMYADEDGKAFTGLGNNIGVVSMGAGAITSLKCMQFKGYSAPVTMPEAVALMQPRRIIIGFGTNNLGGGVEGFIKSYKEGLAAIHKAYEYADIIVSAVPPLDRQRENGSLSMKQVDAFNAAIAEMCKQEGYKFLDTSEALKDPDTGWARKDYTLGDGVHLSKEGVTALFRYIRTHAYITEDTRPKPLKTIPKAEGVPPGLISQDPIAVRGARVPVEFVADEGGKIEGETSQKVKKGQSCSTVTAVPDEGWKFSYWTVSYGSAGESATLTFTVPGDADANGIVITAHFARAECAYHDWEELERTEPTCALDGSAHYRCRVCAVEKTESLPATGLHNYNSSGVCTVCGYQAICTVCGQTGHLSTNCPNKCPTCGKSLLDGHTHEPAPTEPPPVDPTPTEPPQTAPPQTDPPVDPNPPTDNPTPTDEPAPTEPTPDPLAGDTPAGDAPTSES